VLEVRDLEAVYGQSQILFGIALEIRSGELITLLGRNGMGKTTTVRSIMGIVQPRRGEIRFEDRAITGMPPYRIAQAGIGLVPEGRQVFPNLTVRENLVATAANRRRASHFWTLDRIFDLFPQLKERQRHYGNHLSGGEQQMLAIGRALMTNPRLLILDEATEGLAPLVRVQIYDSMRCLKNEGLSILVIDKEYCALARVADRHYVIEKGRVAWSGSSKELLHDSAMRHRYLGV
jgi:branched-chain amino acid transport system ATP-binding protein